MSSSEERQCSNGEEYHLRDISFFAYWVQCKECGTYICPRHSSYQDKKRTQSLFLVYWIISYIFYFGLFLIFSPIKGGDVGVVASYIFASVLLFIPYLVLLLIIQRNITHFRKSGAINECPKCQGAINVVYHDIFLYFWLFFIHILYLSTIFNEVGIFFYNFIYSSYGLSISLLLVVLLVCIIIFIIWLFKQVGGQFFSRYKTSTRVWLGEVFSIFLYMAINVILLTFLNLVGSSSQLAEDALVSYTLFYSFTSVTFWYFPSFLIGSVIYKVAQKYLLNIKRSVIIKCLIAVLFTIIPFFLWGLLSLSLNIYYTPTFFEDLIPFYSTVFNEIAPAFLIALLLGIGIASLIRKKIVNSYYKILLVSAMSLLVVFLLFENIYYLITGTFLLDLLPSTLTPIILLLLLIGGLIVLFYELFSNWVSTTTHWGKSLEKHLGSLLYPILIGFIFVTLSLSFSVIVLMSTSSSIIPSFQLTANISILKLIFLITFIIGLVIGLKFTPKTIEQNPEND